MSGRKSRNKGKAWPQNAICGHCGNKYKDHYFEDEIYCYDNTTGDVWDPEPEDGFLMDIIREKHSDVVFEVTQEWKRENGHITEGQDQ